MTVVKTIKTTMDEKKAVAIAMIAMGVLPPLGGLSTAQFKILRRLRKGTYDIQFIDHMHEEHGGLFDTLMLPVLRKRQMITIEDGETEITPVGLLTLERKERMARERLQRFGRYGK